MFDRFRRWLLGTPPAPPAPAALRAIRFRHDVKHGTLHFLPGIAFAFEDPDAAPYFIAAGYADDTGDPPQRVFALGEIDIDPATVFGGGEHRGKRAGEVTGG